MVDVMVLMLMVMFEKAEWECEWKSNKRLDLLTWDEEKEAEEEE